MIAATGLLDPLFSFLFACWFLLVLAAGFCWFLLVLVPLSLSLSLLLSLSLP